MYIITYAYPLIDLATLWFANNVEGKYHVTAILWPCKVKIVMFATDDVRRCALMIEWPVVMPRQWHV